MKDGKNMNYNYILYKIYYGDELVYIGRTTQNLKDRLRLHFFGKPMVKKIDILRTTKIEYTLCETMADMYLYEIYLINYYKPPINKDDKAKDDLTIVLPEPKFYPYWDNIIDKWKDKQIHELLETAPLNIEDDFLFWE